MGVVAELFPRRREEERTRSLARSSTSTKENRKLTTTCFKPQFDISVVLDRNQAPLFFYLSSFFNSSLLPHHPLYPSSPRDFVWKREGWSTQGRCAPIPGRKIGKAKWLACVDVFLGRCTPILGGCRSSLLDFLRIYEAISTVAIDNIAKQETI